MTSEASAERLRDLLADRATVGLDPAQQEELEALAACHPGLDDDGYEIAAAAAHLALGVERGEVPPALRRRILADAAQFGPRQG